jgi:hypothetical protein
MKFWLLFSKEALAPLMPEVAHSGQHHGDPGSVRRGDDLMVPH